jgi:hypothetical protein
MGWTSTEELICVLEHGLVRIFNLHGEYTQFSMGQVWTTIRSKETLISLHYKQDAKEYGITDCHIWCNGLVVLTRNNCLVAITDLNEPRPQNLADAGSCKI